VYKVEGYEPKVITVTAAISKSITSTFVIPASAYCTPTAVVTVTTPTLVTVTSTMLVYTPAPPSTVTLTKYVTKTVSVSTVIEVPLMSKEGSGKPPKELLSLSLKLGQALLAPQTVYMNLKDASGPIANALKKSFQSKANIITSMARASDVLNKFLDYLSKYESSKKALLDLLKKQIDYNTIYSMYMNLQSMKVNLKMADVLFDELSSIISELKRDEPMASPQKVKEVFGKDPKDLIIYLSKAKLTIKEASEVLDKIRRAGGIDNLVNSFVKEQIDEAHSLFLKLKEVWSKIKREYQAEIRAYETNLELLRGG